MHNTVNIENLLPFWHLYLPSVLNSGPIQLSKLNCHESRTLPTALHPDELRERDSNPQPPGYEPGQLPIANPPR